jgi:hypothetical protein
VPYTLLGIFLGWLLSLLTRRYEDVWFGAKLKIDAEHAPQHKTDTGDRIYMRFRVRNTTKRRIAKDCRAYLVALHEVGGSRPISENLLPDSYQIPWAGTKWEPRDIPPKVNQYADIVRFSKDEPGGWEFRTTPELFENLGGPKVSDLKAFKGVYQFTVVVAGDAVPAKTHKINIEYRGDWHGARLYDP